MLQNMAQNSARVPLWIRGPILLSCFAYAGWSFYSGTGPWAWLVALQLQYLDGYYLKLTILLLLGVCLLPAVPVMLVLGLVFSAGATNGDSGAPASGGFSQRIERSPTTFAFALVGLGCMVIGGYWGVKSAGYGELTPHVLGEAEWPPSNGYLALEGRALRDSALVWREGNVSNGTVYVVMTPSRSVRTPLVLPSADGAGGGKDEPHVAPSGGKDEAPAAGSAGSAGTGSSPTGDSGYRVVLKMWESEMNELLAGQTIEGTIDLPPTDILRADFADSGYTLAPDARVFLVGNNPSETRNFALVFLAVGAVMTALFGGLFMVLSKRS